MLKVSSSLAVVCCECCCSCSDGCVVVMSVLLVERITQTVEITKHTVDIEEKGVKLKLTIVDTPGFGDAVNNTEWYIKGFRVSNSTYSHMMHANLMRFTLLLNKMQYTNTILMYKYLMLTKYFIH